MKCPVDNGFVRITHTYSPSGDVKTQRGVCDVCKRAYTVTSKLEPESTAGSARVVAAKRRSQMPLIESE